MTTVAELTLDAELRPLEENASLKGWSFERTDPTSFILGMKAKDGSTFWLNAKCDCFPSIPPAWHWYSFNKKACDRPQDTPKGGGFFHDNGLVCAPWNRLAYKSVNAELGPHGDWDIGEWRTNPKNGACIQIAAMALRIFVELNGQHYKGRKG